MRDRIFQLLLTAEGYISGEEISNQVGISRAAVWKHIKALRDEGYKIDAAGRQGYKLTEGGLRLSEQEPYLRTAWLGRQQEFHPLVTGSTSDLAKQAGDGDGVNGLVIVADQQQKGRGRLGRGWVAPAGVGIWMSLLLRPQLSPAHAPQLTLATAIGVVKALRSFGFDAGIKWPNDVLIGGRKVCGILTEMRADMDKIDFVVVGIGINVLNQDFPPELADVATSLRLAAAASGLECPERARVTAAVLNELELAYEQLYDEGFAPLAAEWLAHSVTIDREVKVTTLNDEICGLAKTIDSEGHLILELADGSEEVVIYGDVNFC